MVPGHQAEGISSNRVTFRGRVKKVSDDDRADRPRVAIISRHRLCREALLSSLERIASVRLLGDSLPDEKTIGRLSVDVLILDARLPDGLALAGRLRGRLPSLAMVLFGMAGEEQAGSSAGGFVAHVNGDGSAAEFATAVQRALRGERAPVPAAAPSALPMLPNPILVPARPDRDALTPREQAVLRLASEGLANKEIARALRISEATVKNHMHKVLGKMGARRRSAAAALYLRDSAARAAADQGPALGC